MSGWIRVGAALGTYLRLSAFLCQAHCSKQSVIERLFLHVKMALVSCATAPAFLKRCGTLAAKSVFQYRSTALN